MAQKKHTGNGGDNWCAVDEPPSNMKMPGHRLQVICETMEWTWGSKHCPCAGTISRPSSPLYRLFWDRAVNIGFKDVILIGGFLSYSAHIPWFLIFFALKMRKLVFFPPPETNPLSPFAFSLDFHSHPHATGRLDAHCGDSGGTDPRETRRGVWHEGYTMRKVFTHNFVSRLLGIRVWGSRLHIRSFCFFLGVWFPANLIAQLSPNRFYSPEKTLRKSYLSPLWT